MRVPNFIFILILLISGACSRKDQQQVIVIHDEQQVDSLLASIGDGNDPQTVYMSIWWFYIRNGKFEEAVTSAEKVIRDPDIQEKQELMLYAKTYLAQSYLFLEKYDSSWHYLVESEKLLKEQSRENSFIEELIQNTMAIYNVKARHDYAAAVYHFSKAYNVAVRSKDTLNQCALLCNIASIYNIREDSLSIGYAYDAERLGRQVRDRDLEVWSRVTLASSLYLSGQYEEAYERIRKAVERMKQGDVAESNFAYVYAVYGDILLGMGQVDDARSAYDLAIDHISSAKLSTQIKVHASLGRYYFTRKDFRSSICAFRRAEQISDETQNTEYVHLIYKGLLDNYEVLSHSDSTLYYYKKYTEAFNRRVNFKNEQRFRDLELKYHDIRYESQIQEFNNRMIIYTLIIILISISLVYLYILNKRKKKMYLNIVSQYENYRKKIADLEKERSEKAKSQNDSMFLLYQKLEKMMKEEKIYRNPDLSAQKIAETLHTNMSYISSIVNQFSGKTLPSYINSYRIEDVVEALSDPKNDAPIKEIFFHAGYLSSTTSYRVFQKEIGCTPTQYRENIRKIASEHSQNTNY